MRTMLMLICLLLIANVKAESAKDPPKGVKFIQAIDASLVQICALYAAPLSVATVTENQSYNNSETLLKQIFIFTISQAKLTEDYPQEVMKIDFGDIQSLKTLLYKMPEIPIKKVLYRSSGGLPYLHSIGRTSKNKKTSNWRNKVGTSSGGKGDEKS